MRKVYTKIDKAYVFPDCANLRSLKPDSCAVKIVDKKPCVIPLGDLQGKEVENGGRDDYSPVWGYQSGKNEPYILINGQKKRSKFCDFCKDRLNGITGNCLNKDIKPAGCAFQPVNELKAFDIDLDGWEKLRSVDLNPDTAFFRPFFTGITFDPEVIRRNRKIRRIARHLPQYQKEKIEKYCSRCIYQGTCYLRSHKIVEHCMVTEEEMTNRCLVKIRRRYGSIEAYLNMLAYAGGKVMCQPRSYVQESEWRVSQPFGKAHYEILKPFNSYSGTKIARDVVERQVTPCSVPETNREKIAALAWHYLDHYHYHRLWVSLKPEGIEATHHVRGPYRFFRAETFTSFNEIHYFFNR